MREAPGSLQRTTGTRKPSTPSSLFPPYRRELGRAQPDTTSTTPRVRTRSQPRECRGLSDPSPGWGCRDHSRTVRHLDVDTGRPLPRVPPRHHSPLTVTNLDQPETQRVAGDPHGSYRRLGARPHTRPCPVKVDVNFVQLRKGKIFVCLLRETELLKRRPPCLVELL